MKKTWIAILTCLLALLLAAPALAQTTGVNLDGKSYCFSGGPGTYEADGITFIIGEDEVTVRRPGEEDLVLTLYESAEEDAVLAEGSAPEAFSTELTCATVVADGGDTCYSVQKEDDVVVEITQSSTVEAGEEGMDPAHFAVYEPFGLKCDAVGKALYFQGARVRIFEDELPVQENVCVLQNVDEAGSVDVRTVRDEKGTILRLEALSDAEFAARNLKDWTEPQVQVAAVDAVDVTVGVKLPAETVCTEGEEWTPAEKQAFYEKYAPYGLEYDPQADALYYMGERVRDLTDVSSSNGESRTSGKFEGSITHIRDELGTVDIETIRDYARPNADGEGKLTGIKVIRAE